MRAEMATMYQHQFTVAKQGQRISLATTDQIAGGSSQCFTVIDTTHELDSPYIFHFPKTLLKLINEFHS